MLESAIQSWPSTLEEFWTWHVEAACRQVDSSLFYSPEGERGPTRLRRERAAKQVCARCDVRELCAAYALANREPYGTWGGMSERDRRAAWQRTDFRDALRSYRTALAAWEARTQALRGRTAARAQAALLAQLRHAARARRRAAN